MTENPDVPTVLDADFFSQFIGETFVAFPAEAGRYELRLTEVTKRTTYRAMPGARPPFSLIFHGPPAAFLMQATWRLHHPKAGELDIFLSPLGPGDGLHRYQAIFA